MFSQIHRFWQCQVFFHCHALELTVMHYDPDYFKKTHSHFVARYAVEWMCVVKCWAHELLIVKPRSTDSDGLKTLESRYGSCDFESSVDAASADFGPVNPKGGRTHGSAASGLESILAFVEFHGVKEDSPTMRAVGTGQNSASSSGPPGSLNGGGIGRTFTWRRRDGCMWMRVRRRRRQDPNRFLDFLFQAPVLTLSNKFHSSAAATAIEFLWRFHLWTILGVAVNTSF